LNPTRRFVKNPTQPRAALLLLLFAMVRFTRLLLLAGVALSFAAVPAVLGQEDVEPTVDCEALMTAFPNCTEMVYTICTDGTPTACGATLSTQQVETNGSNSTNETAVVESPCEKYVCFENGTYADMEDDAAPTTEDDAPEGNGTSTGGDTEDDTQAAPTEDDSKGTAGAAAAGTSGAFSALAGGTSSSGLALLATAAGIMTLAM
jgi:hypothetical protein